MKTRYSTCSTARSRSVRSVPAGRLKSDPVSLIVCLARLIRCAIVASGTPKAAAICAVDSPPTARRVSAIWLGADSSGWQQPNSRASESSRSVGFGVGRGAEQFRLRGGHRDQFLPVPPRLLAADLVHQAPRADRDQPAARVLRDPVGWPLQGRREQRLLAGVLAQVKLPVPAHQRAEDLRRQFPQQVLDAPVAGHRSGLASCRTGQNSTGSTSAHGMSAAICSARSSLSQSSR